MYDISFFTILVYKVKINFNFKMIQKIVYIKNVLSNKIFLFSACDLSILLQMVYRLLVFYCLTDCKSS